MNYIVKNQELERAESYFKNLSDYLKETLKKETSISLLGDSHIS